MDLTKKKELEEIVKDFGYHCLAQDSIEGSYDEDRLKECLDQIEALIAEVRKETITDYRNKRRLLHN